MLCPKDNSDKLRARPAAVYFRKDNARSISGSPLIFIYLPKSCNKSLTIVKINPMVVYGLWEPNDEPVIIIQGYLRPLTCLWRRPAAQLLD